MGSGKMFNGNVENIQLTRQLSAGAALKIAEVWITEDKIFLFYPGNYAILQALSFWAHQVNMFLVSNLFFPL